MDKQPILALARDLFFGSRIGEAARATGHPFKRASSRAALLSELEATHPALVVVDLASSPGDLSEIAARAEGARLVAFGPHVDTESRDAARAAGFHEVVANSRLARELPALLARNLPSTETADDARPA